MKSMKGVKSAAFRGKSAVFREKGAFSGGKYPTIASNGGTIASNGETIASNGETIASNGGTIASNGGAIASNGETIASNDGTIASNGGTIASNGETIASNGGTIAFPIRVRDIPTRVRGVPAGTGASSRGAAASRRITRSQLAKDHRTRHKARVKDERTTKSESSFGKKLWCVLIVLFLGGIGWQMWKLNAYNNAVREAEEEGFMWIWDDAISIIRQDWHNALKKETWGEHPRVLRMGEVPDLGRYREMLHQLRPKELNAFGCKDENVDALKGLTGLQTLYLQDCTALQNLDGLKGLTALQWLNLRGCDKIPAAALRELRAALPNTVITFPDGTQTQPN